MVFESVDSSAEDLLRCGRAQEFWVGVRSTTSARQPLPNGSAPNTKPPNFALQYPNYIAKSAESTCDGCVREAQQLQPPEAGRNLGLNVTSCNLDGGSSQAARYHRLIFLAGRNAALPIPMTSQR